MAGRGYNVDKLERTWSNFMETGTVILSFEHDQNSATFSNNVGEHCGTLCYVQLRSVTPYYIVSTLGHTQLRLHYTFSHVDAWF